MKAFAEYGKLNVGVYRTHAAPLRGVTPIPESPFTGRANALFACAVDVDLRGEAFLASYTAGENRAVIATDSLKNFVHAVALEYEGATLEGLLLALGQRLVTKYAQIERVCVRGREIPYVAAKGTRDVLFGRSRADVSVAEYELARDRVHAHRCGREGLELASLGAHAFAGFVRDEFTTLPETTDRPLHLRLDVRWRYADANDSTGQAPERYVAGEQVRDLVATVLDGFASRSIQQVVHEMATRLLARFPQLAEVSLEAQNRLWDQVRASERDPRVRVYTDPRPTYGRIALTLRR